MPTRRPLMSSSSRRVPIARSAIAPMVPGESVSVQCGYRRIGTLPFRHEQLDRQVHELLGGDLVAQRLLEDRVAHHDGVGDVGPEPGVACREAETLEALLERLEADLVDL